MHYKQFNQGLVSWWIGIYMNGAIKNFKKGVLHIRHKLNGKSLSVLLNHSSRGVQSSTHYSEIQSSNYFDESWYRHAYKNEIEYPNDLLLDYLQSGIPNGRDPSPYFNTILYRREHDVPPEQALVHFLRSGMVIDSGAYRNEQALLDAQCTYLTQTETALIADSRVSTKPFAVYLQCGAGSLWGNWRPSQDQTWDLLVNHYDATYVGKIPCGVEFRQLGKNPGTKFTSFHSLLTKYPHMLEPYEYIFLLDDDVTFKNGDINRLFSIIQQHSWEMAQPSLSINSQCSFQVFFNPNKRGWRQVNGVELMMPVYSSRILSIVKQLIGQSISGWGFDPALSMLAAEQGFRAAVVDDVIAQHFKPINADIGQYYQMLHRAQIYPEIEFTHMQVKYGFTKPLFYEI
jgi:hypothetical protein